MMEPESAPAGPEEEPGTEEARQESAAPAESPDAPAAEQPVPAAPEADSVPAPASFDPPTPPETPRWAEGEADSVPAPASFDPPPPPDTPRWAESAAVTEIQPAPTAPAVDEASPAEAVPSAEVAPEAPVAFEAPPAPPVEPAPEAPVAFEAPPAPADPVVDPMFARGQAAAAAASPVPDQGWGVAGPPPFAPEAGDAQGDEAVSSAVEPTAVEPVASAPFGAPDAAPEASLDAEETAPEPAFSVPDNPAAEFAAAVEPDPEPEPTFEAQEPLAPVIPINVDGMWVAGRGRGSGGAKSPKEKGAKGPRFKRSSNSAGLEVVGDAPQASLVPEADAVPAEEPAGEPAKPKRVFGKELRFGRKKKKVEDPAPEGGIPAAAAAAASVAPSSDGGFGAVAPPQPPAPGFAPSSQPDPAQNAGFGSGSGFGTDSGFGSGFGAPAASPEGVPEPAQWKKKRSLRLPSTSGGKFGRPMLIILVVAALVAAALGYLFFGRGGPAGQPAYALDFAAGQTYTYRMTMALNGQLSLSGRNVPLQETLGATAAWNVQSVDANGVATVDVQLSDLHLSVNGQDTPTGDLPAASLHYTMRLAPDGSILSGGGGFGALSGGSSGPAGEIPGTDQLTPLLPGHDVNPGDQWDKTFDSDLPYGMGHVHFVTHSTYVKNEDVGGVTTSVIASKMSLPLHMRVDLAKMMKEMGSGTAGLPAGSHPVVVYGGHVSGTTTGWFDPSTRQMVKTSADVQFRMAMTFRGLPPGTQIPGGKMLFRGGVIVSLQKV